MPPYRYYQPGTLQAVALARVSNLALDSCLQIQHRLPERQHLVEAKMIQQHLLNIRPLLDDVFNHALDTCRRQRLKIRVEVVLTALMHPSMKIITYPFIDEPSCYKLKDSFIWEIGLWDTYLKQVPNLIELDIRGVKETDDILEIVGRCCPKLEVILFSAWATSKWMCHLGNLKCLRVIRSERKPETPEGVRLLVQNLPVLEVIDYHHMGNLLVSLNDIESVALKVCKEHAPNQQNLEAIVRLCPNLIKLHLGEPYLCDTMQPSHLDLTPLTESSLQISDLSLRNVIVGDLEEFFFKKGIFIKHLHLFNILWSKDFERMTYLVGIYCPMIETLAISINVSNYNNYSLQTMQLNLSDFQTPLQPMFTNLLDLQFTFYSQFSWERVLSCLVDAKRLQTLSLSVLFVYNSVFNEAFEHSMSDLLAQNPMSELQNLRLCYVDISQKMLLCFFNLPKLKLVHCLNRPQYATD